MTAAASVLPGAPHHEKGADIQRPIRHAAHGEIQSFDNLPPQGFPGGTDIAGPEHRTVTLAARVAGTGQIQHPFLFCGLSLVLVHAAGVVESKGIGPGRVYVLLMLIAHQHKTLPGLPLHLAAPIRAAERLRGITPPGINSLGKEPLVGLLPVQSPGLRRERVVSRQVMEHKAFFHKLLIILCPGIHIGPYGNHGMNMHVMDTVHRAFQVRIPFPIYDLFSPVTRLPGVPVLNNTIQWNVHITVTAHRLLQFVPGSVCFLRLDIAESPPRRQYGPAGQQSVAPDDFIQTVSGDKVIIQLIHGIHIYIGAVLIVVKRHQTAAVQKYTVPSRGYKKGNGYPHVMLIQILAVTAIIIDSFLALAQPMNGLVPGPVKRQFGPIGPPVHHRLQITDKVPLPVHGFDPVDNRSFVSRSVVDHIHRREGFARFLQIHPAGARLAEPACSVRPVDFHLYFSGSQRNCFFRFFYTADRRILRLSFQQHRRFPHCLVFRIYTAENCVAHRLHGHLSPCHLPNFHDLPPVCRTGLSPGLHVLSFYPQHPRGVGSQSLPVIEPSYHVRPRDDNIRFPPDFVLILLSGPLIP